MKIFGSAMSNFCVFNFRRGKAVARGLTEPLAIAWCKEPEEQFANLQSWEIRALLGITADGIYSALKFKYVRRLWRRCVVLQDGDNGEAATLQTTANPLLDWFCVSRLFNWTTAYVWSTPVTSCSVLLYDRPHKQRPWYFRSWNTGICATNVCGS